MIGAAALHAIADVENHQPVVPVRRVHQAVDDVQVMHVPAGIRTVCSELGDLLRVRGVRDVDGVHGSRAVVREKHELAVFRVFIDVDRVDASRDAISKL